MSLSNAPAHHFNFVTEPISLQRRVFSLLDINADKTLPVSFHLDIR